MSIKLSDENNYQDWQVRTHREKVFQNLFLPPSQTGARENVIPGLIVLPGICVAKSSMATCILLLIQFSLEFRNKILECDKPKF